MTLNKVAVIVDDDEMDALYIQNALSGVMSDLQTVWYSDPALALQEFEELGDVRFMLVDLNMPRQNGLQFLENLRKKENSTFPPVIIFTSSGLEDDRVAAYRACASAYVQKPSSLAGYDELAEHCVGFWVKAMDISEPPGPRLRY